MDVGRKILLTMMLGVTASISGNAPSRNLPPFNSSFPGGSDKLSEPIIIPNLPAQRPFTSTSRTTQTHQIKNNTKAQGYFLGKIYYPDESLSQESNIDVKFDESTKADDNSLKFSARYSVKPESEESTTESSEEGEDVREEFGGEKSSRNVTDVEDVSAPLEQDKNLPGSDAISGNEIYKAYSDFSENPYPTHAYFDDREDEKADTRQYSDANEPRETEELEVSPATNEPYPALQRPTSFQNSHYPGEEFENDETSSEISRESDGPAEEADKRSGDDYRESGPKDYDSVQTPLKEIKFRGPHSVKDEFESERSITRLSPIRRRPISHSWPYSKAQLEEETEKLNEISDSDETEESKEGTKANSELSGLEQAAVNDEVELKQTRNKKPNYYNDKNNGRNKQSGLSEVEAKDQEGPLYQGIKQYRDEAKKKPPTVHPTFNYAPKPRPSVKVNQDLWSVGSPTKATIYEELFSRQSASKKIKPSKFNITKELDSNFLTHQFLGPVVFKHNVEQPKIKPTEKPHPKPQTEASRNVVAKELEKKEAIDVENLANQKEQRRIFSRADSELPSQTFDHQEESDEMYNQILANIQSVFGLRTQPLKSAAARKSPEEPPRELNVEENRALTWALPLRKRARPDVSPAARSSGTESERAVKSKSGEGRELRKSQFPFHS